MREGILKKNNLSYHEERQDRSYTPLADLLLMSHLSQSLFPLMGRHFMAFSLFATWHKLLLS
jgi:hypothetical protein